MTPKDLTLFEERIAELYEQGKIRAPVHLRSGNEAELCEIFRRYSVGDNDYVFSTWASHAHCLLKGVPADKVEMAILEGRSITLNFPEHKMFSSAIVGGILPISVGVAASLKRRGVLGRIFCFLGDMAFHGGVAHESICYAIGHDLPITFIVEDNGVSVCTDTEETCGIKTAHLMDNYWGLVAINECRKCDIIYYKYENGHAHSGTGTFVSF